MVVQTGLISPPKRRTDVPLTEVHSLVAIGFEQLGDRHLSLQEVHVMLVILNHVIHSGAQMLPSREEGGP